jgi:mycofactocin precursor
MEQDTTTLEGTTDTTAGQATDAGDGSTDELVDELLIEEISIDGMCGVY